MSTSLHNVLGPALELDDSINYTEVIISASIVATSIALVGYIGFLMLSVRAEMVQLIGSKIPNPAAEVAATSHGQVHQTQWHPVALTDNNSYIIAAPNY